MRKVWIVVANTSQSTIYRAESTNSLVVHQTLIHPQSHLNSRDLVADGQGRFGTSTLQEKTSVKEKEANEFATQLIKFLQEGVNQKQCERIYLIANPSFLGVLRKSLPANVSKMIASEVQKDLTECKAEQIREYLPPVL